MNKNLVVLVSIVVAMGVSAVMRNHSQKSEPNVSSLEFLTQISNDANKTLPKMVDQDTEIHSISAQEGILAYNYRLVNLLRSDLDIGAFVQEMKPKITASACTSPDTRPTFLDQGVTLRYSYMDRNNTQIAAIDVVRSDCSE